MRRHPCFGGWMQLHTTCHSSPVSGVPLQSPECGSRRRSRGVQSHSSRRSHGNATHPPRPGSASHPHSLGSECHHHLQGCDNHHPNLDINRPIISFILLIAHII